MNRLSASMFLALVLLGCPKRVPLAPPAPVASPEELLKLTAAAEAQVLGIKGEAKVRMDSPGAKGVVTFFVAAEKPARVHLEPLDFFGRPQAMLVSDGERFGLFQAEEGRYLCGPASPHNLSRFLPVVLPPNELVALLLGQVPRLVPEESAWTADPESGEYVLTLKAGQVTQTLRIDARHHRVRHSHIEGIRAYDVAFDDFEPIESGQGPPVTFPRQVLLTAPAAATTVELVYKDVVVNPAPDASLYEIAPPPKVPVVVVDALGNPRAAADGETCR